MSTVPPIDTLTSQKAWSFRLTPETLVALRKAQSAGERVRVEVRSSNPRAMSLAIGEKSFPVVPARTTTPAINVLGRRGVEAGIGVLPQRLAIRKEGLTEADLTRAKRLAEAEKPKRQTMEIRPGETMSRAKKSTMSSRASQSSSASKDPSRRQGESLSAEGDKAAPEGSRDRVCLMHILAGAGRAGMDFTPLRERSGMGRNACQQTLLEIGKFTMIDRVWRLRQDQWKSIQPDWKHWTRSERKAAIEVQRSTLQALRVPVNDAIWSRIREAEEKMTEEAPMPASGPSASTALSSSGTSSLSSSFTSSGDGLEASGLGTTGPSGTQTGSSIAPGALGVGRRSRGGALGELKAKRAAAAKEEQKRKRLAAAAAEKSAANEKNSGKDSEKPGPKSSSSATSEGKGKKSKKFTSSSLEGAPATFTPPKATFSGGKKVAKTVSVDSSLNHTSTGEKEGRQRESSPTPPSLASSVKEGRSTRKSEEGQERRAHRALSRLTHGGERGEVLSEGEGGMDLERESPSTRLRSDLGRDLERPSSASGTSKRDVLHRDPTGWDDGQMGYASDGAPEIQRRTNTRRRDLDQSTKPSGIARGKGVSRAESRQESPSKPKAQRETLTEKSKGSQALERKRRDVLERRTPHSVPEDHHGRGRPNESVEKTHRPRDLEDTMTDEDSPREEAISVTGSYGRQGRNERAQGKSSSLYTSHEEDQDSTMREVTDRHEGEEDGESTRRWEVEKEDDDREDEERGEEEGEGKEGEGKEGEEAVLDEIGPTRVLEVSDADPTWPLPNTGLRVPKVTTQADLERLFMDFQERLQEYTLVRQRLADRVAEARAAGNPIGDWDPRPSSKDGNREGGGIEASYDGESPEERISRTSRNTKGSQTPVNYDEDDPNGESYVIEGESLEDRKKRIATCNAIMSPMAIWEWRRGKALEAWLMQAKRISWEACRVNGWEVEQESSGNIMDSRKRSRYGDNARRRRRHRGEEQS